MALLHTASCMNALSLFFVSFFFNNVDDWLTLVPQALVSIQPIYVARTNTELIGVGGLQANIFKLRPI